MSAARETIGGFYGNDYIKYIFLLIYHMIIPLIIGLVINKITYKNKEKLKRITFNRSYGITNFTNNKQWYNTNEGVILWIELN